MIRNILFDLGGVIMDIRRSDCIEAFRKLGMAHPSSFWVNMSRAALLWE